MRWTELNAPEEAITRVHVLARHSEAQPGLTIAFGNGTEVLNASDDDDDDDNDNSDCDPDDDPGNASQDHDSDDDGSITGVNDDNEMNPEDNDPAANAPDNQNDEELLIARSC